MEIDSMKNSAVNAYQQTQKMASQPENKTASTRADVENINLNTKVEESAGGSKEKPSDAQEKSDGTQTNQNKTLKSAVEEMNKQMHDSEAIFGIHDKTNRVTIKIVDKETKEVLKEYPPEQTLDMIAKVWELAGIMVDEKR